MSMNARTQPVLVMPGGARLNSRVYDTAIKSVAELVENAQSAGATWCSVRLSPDKLLTFVDNGPGIEEGSDLAACLNFGYTSAQLAHERELNRLFHRGLVLAADSLGRDVFVFTVTDTDADQDVVKVVRYGHALTTLVEEGAQNLNMPAQTLSCELRVSGVTAGYGDNVEPVLLFQNGVPADEETVSLLLGDSPFATLLSLATHIKEAMDSGSTRTGFGGVLVLKPGIDVHVQGSDIVQGSCSLREYLTKRQAPEVKMPGFTVPACRIKLQGVELCREKWAEARASPAIRRQISLNDHLQLEASLRILAPPVGGDVKAHPSVRVIMPGSSIASELPLNTVHMESAWGKIQSSAWTRRPDGKLDGHHTDGWPLFCALVGDCEPAACNGRKKIESGSTLSGLQPLYPTTPLVLLEKESKTGNSFSVFEKRTRYILLGGGCQVLLHLKHLGGELEMSELLSADKDRVRNEALVHQLRRFVHEALVAFALKAFGLAFVGESPLWENVIKERQAKSMPVPVPKPVPVPVPAPATMATRKSIPPPTSTPSPVAAGSARATKEVARATNAPPSAVVRQPRACEAHADEPRRGMAGSAAVAAAGHADAGQRAAGKRLGHGDATPLACGTVALHRERREPATPAPVPAPAPASGVVPLGGRRGAQDPNPELQQEAEEPEPEAGPSQGAAKRQRTNDTTQAMAPAAPIRQRCCAVCRQAMDDGATRRHDTYMAEVERKAKELETLRTEIDRMKTEHEFQMQRWRDGMLYYG